MSDDRGLTRRRSILGLGTVAAGALAVAQAGTPTKAEAAVLAGEGYLLLDSFAGATADDKLTAALSLVRAETYKRAIMFPRGLTSLTRTQRTFGGMKLIGPPVVGWQNVEQGGGGLNPCRVRLNCGTGAASWLVGSGVNFNGAVRDLAFESTNGNTQFFHHPVVSGTAYAWNFHNLGFQAFKHVLGNATTPVAFTLCSTTGHWNMTTARGTQANIAGSDNDFWVDGTCNIGPSGKGSSSGAGQYLLILQTGKSNYGGVYLTADDNWRAVRLQGTMKYQAGNRLRGFRIEGRNAGDPSAGALVKVVGGGWYMDGFDLNYAMANPGAYAEVDRGMVHQTGGNLHMQGVTVDRAIGVSESVPAVFVSGGECITRMFQRGIKGGAWTGRPRVQQTAAGKVIDSDATVRLVTAA